MNCGERGARVSRWPSFPRDCRNPALTQPGSGLAPGAGTAHQVGGRGQEARDSHELEQLLGVGDGVDGEVSAQLGVRVHRAPGEMQNQILCGLVHALDFGFCTDSIRE